MSLSQDKISWSDLIFTADADNELFSNMRIVTAKSEFIAKAQELALNQLYRKNGTLLDSEIDRVTADIIKTTDIKVYESASVSDEAITVCINDAVITDDTIWKALDMVYTAIKAGGTWTSNVPLVFEM